jgi:hypothetical protein
LPAFLKELEYFFDHFDIVELIKKLLCHSCIVLFSQQLLPLFYVFHRFSHYSLFILLPFFTHLIFDKSLDLDLGFLSPEVLKDEIFKNFTNTLLPAHSTETFIGLLRHTHHLRNNLVGDNLSQSLREESSCHYHVVHAIFLEVRRNKLVYYCHQMLKHLWQIIRVRELLRSRLILQTLRILLLDYLEGISQEEWHGCEYHLDNLPMVLFLGGFHLVYHL